MTRLTYEDWRDFLFRIQAICSPAELQGLAAGHLSGGADSDAWLSVATQAMDVERGDLDEPTLLGLDALRETVQQALRDRSYGFELLLPDDALPLTDRIRAVSEWAQGFLLGLGQAESGIGRKLDEDAQGFLKDLAEIVQADTQTEEAEQNEVILVDLVEYVRLGTLSLYAQLALPSSPPTQLEKHSDKGALH